MTDGWNAARREIEILQLREALIEAQNRLIAVNRELLDYESPANEILDRARKASFRGSALTVGK